MTSARITATFIDASSTSIAPCVSASASASPSVRTKMYIGLLNQPWLIGAYTASAGLRSPSHFTSDTTPTSPVADSTGR